MPSAKHALLVGARFADLGTAIETARAFPLGWSIEDGLVFSNVENGERRRPMLSQIDRLYTSHRLSLSFETSRN